MELSLPLVLVFCNKIYLKNLENLEDLSGNLSACLLAISVYFSVRLRTVGWEGWRGYFLLALVFVFAPVLVLALALVLALVLVLVLVLEVLELALVVFFLRVAVLRLEDSSAKELTIRTRFRRISGCLMEL